ncbi:MAG: RHS repeat-associated core domain-containing protein [Actinobacteria bacterium]|nr:RHS repeat-associated core domain-containing protein [Actinomycetota bacterium]
MGNITRSVQDNVENLYTYDELCRLTSWTEKEGEQTLNEERYFYDGNGNITKVEKIGSEENHAYDNANQCADTGFTYDENGNLTSDGEWNYEYERGSRLVSATNDADNLKVVFGYDPQGKRYSKTAYERDGQGQYTVEKYARFYHYDSGGNILCETDALGNIIHSYVYDASGHPIAFTQDLGQGSETFYIHSNARGDVVCITDDVMNWAKKFSYDPWGNITSETVSSSEYDNLECPYGYAGYFFDSDTGLYYMPARYYSPSQRRFLTKDSHPGSKSNPLTLNPYQYCHNNPVNNVDPSGQYAFENWHFSFGPGMNEFFNQMAADNAARSRDMASSLGHFTASMASFNADVHSSMARAGDFGIGKIMSGFSKAISGVNSLKGFNWGGLAAVGIRGGVVTGSLGHQLSQWSYAFKCAVLPNPFPAGKSFWGTTWDSINSIPHKFVRTMDALANNPISKTAWGLVNVIGGAVSGQSDVVADGLNDIKTAGEDLVHGNLFGEEEYRKTHWYGD